MAPTRSLQDLLASLNEQVAQIDGYLTSADQPRPSFSLGAGPALQLPADLDRVRQNAIDACDELRAVLQGPLPHLMGLVNKQSNFSSIQAICRFEIAQKLGLQETVSFAELASRTTLDEDNLRRIVRTAVANRIFEEPSKGTVKHNAVSAAISQSAELRDYLMFVCEELLPASSHLVDSLSQFPASEEPNQAGFSLANGGDGKFFDILGGDSVRLQRYIGAMKLIHRSAALNVAHLVGNLGWEENCPELVVDVGGNQGAVCAEILKKYPSVKGVVEDMPEVIADAQAPSELASRMSFVEQNLFSEQSVKMADVYLFRWILHDWPDSYATQIIRHQIPALKPGARLILNEIVLPEPGLIPMAQEQYLRGFDLQIKSLHNSKERDAQEWESLFAKADSRFKLERIRRVPQSLLAIIEVVWQG